MKSLLVSCILAIGLALASCAAPGPVSYTHKTGTVTITEFGDNGRVLGAWEVDASSVMIDPTTDVLTSKYIPHPLRTYRIARNY